MLAATQRLTRVMVKICGQRRQRRRPTQPDDTCERLTVSWPFHGRRPDWSSSGDDEGTAATDVEPGEDGAERMSGRARTDDIDYLDDKRCTSRMS